MNCNDTKGKIYTLLAISFDSIIHVKSTHKMINSTRFPNVMFNSAPAPTPSFEAAFSVAYVSSPVSGIIASAFKLNVTMGWKARVSAAMPKGTNMRSTLTHERKNICRNV
jgi:hypothetical protein